MGAPYMHHQPLTSQGLGGSLSPGAVNVGSGLWTEEAGWCLWFSQLCSCSSWSWGRGSLHEPRVGTPADLRWQNTGTHGLYPSEVPAHALLRA